MKLLQNKTFTVESVFFYLVAILSALPVICFKFFPTLDGPAYLHNSALLHSVLFGHNPVIETYYKINIVPVPNWLANVVLSFFNLLLPGNLAEKALLLIYIIGFPVVFRQLSAYLAPQNIFLSFLVFPFVYSFMLYLGLYNYCLSLVLFTAAIHFWIKIQDNVNTKNIFILLLIVILLYFGHIITWACSFLVAFIFLFFDFLSMPSRHSLRVFGRKLMYLFIIYLPTIALVFEYLGGTTLFFGKSELPFEERLRWFKEIRSIIALDYQKEVEETTLLYFLLQSLLVVAIYNKITGALQAPATSTLVEKIKYFFKNVFNRNDIWLLISLCLLLIFLNMPSTISFIIGGFALEKICFLVFIFCIIWLTLQPWPKWALLACVCFALWVNVKLLVHRWDSTRELNDDAQQFIALSDSIPSNSFVLPLNFSDHWLLTHFSNYAGIEKPLVILENFQAKDGYFPLRWKFHRLPDLRLDTVPAAKLCNNWISNSENPKESIPYVIAWGDEALKTDSCSIAVKQILSERYTVVASSKIARLYKLSNNHSQLSTPR